MKIIKIIAGITAVLLSASAHASNLGYTMLGFDLTSTHYDDDINLGVVTFSSTSGAGLYGSYQFNDNFFLMLGSKGESNEEDGFEITSSSGYLGGGFALPAGNRTDLVMRLALVSGEAEICYNYGSFSFCDSVDDDGYGVGFGVRHLATQNIEVNAEFVHVNMDEFDDTDTLTIGGAVWFAKHHSIRLSLGDSDETKTSSLGYRYTF